MPEQTSLPPPIWLPLAESAIARLRRHEPLRGTDTDKNANRDRDADEDDGERPPYQLTPRGRLLTEMLVTSGAIDRHHPDDRAALRESGADPEAIDLASGAHRPATWVHPHRLLLAIRIAALIGRQADLARWLAPGAVTILAGIEDAGALKKLLRQAFLPENWRASRYQDDGDPTKPTLFVAAPEVQGSGHVTTPAEARFTAAIGRVLEEAGPVLITLPSGYRIPNKFAELLPPVQELPDLDRDILITLLRHTHSATGRIDEATVRAALPDDAALATLTPGALQIALRAETARDVVERIARLLRNPAPTASRSGPDLDAMTGTSQALTTARRMVSDLRGWQRGEVAWSELSRSLLLYGPPGTGKTWLAQAMANAAGISCVLASYGEWQAAGHLGDLLREMRRSFAEARESAPCILVIDEIDALGSRAGDDGHGRSYRSQAIAGLLTELDTLGREEGVILIGTCNHRDRLDPAILRPGRLDLHVEMPLPDETILEQILKKHLPGEDHLALADLARRAVGHTPAELDAGIRASKAAARQERRAPTLDDIARHLDLDDSSPAVTRRVAVHEAGHAIVATALGASRVVRMTLLRDGGETVRRQVDRIGTGDDILDELATHLAGRAAERLVYGNVSAGAGGGPGSDLAIATELAVAFHMRLGLGWRGPVWSEAPIELALRDPQIHDRVRQMLIDAEHRARKVLETEQDVLNDLSEHLFKRRRLSGSDLDDLLTRVQRISRQTT